VSINGANRLGSNSLPELLVFGARAGRAAAEWALSTQHSNEHVPAQLADERRRLETGLLREDGRDRIADLRQAMQATMEESAGIYRTGPSLARAVDALAALQKRAADLRIEDRSHTFNTERVAAVELSFMLEVAETIVTAAYGREESRGA